MTMNATIATSQAFIAPRLRLRLVEHDYGFESFARGTARNGKVGLRSVARSRAATARQLPYGLLPSVKNEKGHGGGQLGFRIGLARTIGSICVGWRRAATCSRWNRKKPG